MLAYYRKKMQVNDRIPYVDKVQSNTFAGVRWYYFRAHLRNISKDFAIAPAVASFALDRLLLSCWKRLGLSERSEEDLGGCLFFRRIYWKNTESREV